jgi:hypothetical protein
MKRLFLFAFVGFVLVTWGNPLVGSARPLAVVNQTDHHIVVIVTYTNCHTDFIALGPGQIKHLRGVCGNRSANAQMPDDQKCYRKFVANEVRQSNIAIVKNGSSCDIILRP